MHKVLCFVDDQQGRDVELILPLVYYSEKYLDCKVEFRFVWDIFSIYIRQPDLVLLPNTVGSKWFFEISKYAHEQNIPVFALTSEGNYRTNDTFDYWGYNTDHVFYQEYVCLWSERTRDFFQAKLPGEAHKMVLTGATGFDRYKIYRFPSKEELLQKKGLSQFKKVIGYAGWAFGKLYSEIGRQELRYFLQDKPDWEEWTMKQRDAVEAILRQLIENNPDILFLLKVHPNETHPHITTESPNEMIRMRDYSNVLYIKDEEPIHDLISASDIWMGFETTTAIEAWMLGKETLLLNPDAGFTRDITYKGSVIVPDYTSVQLFINEFYREGATRSFNSREKAESRKAIIADVIGFGDGQNHLRAAYFLKKSLEKSTGLQKKKVFRMNYFMRSFNLHVGSLFYNHWLFIHLPKFKKTVWAFDRWKLKNIPVLKERYYPFLDAFYKKDESIIE